MQDRVFSLLVMNHFGVLNKVTTLFSRRGCNIRSLSLCATQREELSRITVSVHEETERVFQIYNQLNKLEDVKDVKLLDDAEHIERSMALIQLKKGVRFHRKMVRDEEMNVRQSTLRSGALLLEVIGPTDSVDALVEQLKSHGIENLSRSGRTALSFG